MAHAAKADVQLKRAYLPASPEDGTRILVDRLWPRGVRKADVAIDQWMKDVAPSTELRHWFGHEPSRWEEFQHRYKSELAHNAELVNELRAIAKKGRLTLIYSASDELHNQAVVLRDVLTH